MYKTILSGEDARSALQKGVDKVVTTVGSTLGAQGKTVMISSGYGVNPIVTKDGVTVAANIMVEDEIENVGAMFIRGAASKTVRDAGDGTTSTVVLAGSMIKEGLKQVTAGSQPQAIKRGMEAAVESIVEYIKDKSQKLTPDRLRNIATISANNDKAIGGLIADVYKEIGDKGLITVNKSNNSKTTSETVSGFEFERGYKDPRFITDPKKGVAAYDNPLVLVCNYDLADIKPLEKFLPELLGGSPRPVLIVANDIIGEMEGMLIVNKVKNNIPVVAVKPTSSYRRECLDDICTTTGATLISDDLGRKLESITMDDLGTCEKIVVGKDFTSIVGGKGSAEDKKVRSEEIEVLIEQEEDEQVKAIYEKRLASFNSAVGVINVGGSTDVEIKEKFDRVEDAVKAVESAVAEGISAGGGITLLSAAESLSKLELPEDEMIGVNIVKKALKAPITQILKNAGEDESYIIGKILEKRLSVGYNVKNGEYEDFYETGVLDPTKVIRVSLQNAASVAISIITSDNLMVQMLRSDEK